MNKNKNEHGKYIGYINNHHNKIIELLNDNKSIKDISKIINCSSEGLRLYIIKNNIKYKEKIVYHSDNDYFNNHTEESFYWAGFIAADGNINNKGDFCIVLKASDFEHLEKFKKAVKSNANIYFTKPKEICINNIKTKNTGGCSIRFRNKYWIDSLKHFNIIPNKTKTFTIPDWVINHNFFKHFIRGYFDGDGTFSKHKNLIKLGFCGNLSVINIINNYFKSIITGKPYINKQNNIYILTYQKQQDVVNIINLIYNTSGNAFLNRKKELSLLAIKNNNSSRYFKLSKSELYELYKNYGSCNKIAKLTNYSKSTIYNHLKKHKII